MTGIICDQCYSVCNENDVHEEYGCEKYSCTYQVCNNYCIFTCNSCKAKYTNKTQVYKISMNGLFLCKTCYNGEPTYRISIWERTLDKDNFQSHPCYVRSTAFGDITSK